MMKRIVMTLLAIGLCTGSAYAMDYEVTLVTNDNAKFIVYDEDARLFNTVNNILADTANTDYKRKSIPLPNISSAVLKMLIWDNREWVCNMHQGGEGWVSKGMIAAMPEQERRRSAICGIKDAPYADAEENVYEAIQYLQGADFMGAAELREKYAKGLAELSLLKTDAALEAMKALRLSNALKDVAYTYMPEVWIPKELGMSTYRAAEKNTVSAKKMWFSISREDHTVTIKDAKTNALLHTLLPAHDEEWVNSATFSPDGTKLVVCRHDKKSRIRIR